ncbi:exported hypothetical protein [uncultured Paludibacter sp.]|nr:exported hypothetical protein [uncultured Paludibacter sp.]
MIMKNYGIIALIAIFITTMSVSAQQPSDDNNGMPPRERHFPQREMMKQKLSPKERAENMQKKLSLTAEETQKVQALLEKEDAQREKVKADHQKMMEQKKDETQKMVKKMREEHQQNLEKIIGKEKAAQWDAIQKERFQKMEQRAERVKEKRTRMMKKMNRENRQMKDSI